MKARSRRSGYTLFEIILVMGVMVILGGLSYPSLKGMSGYYRQQGAVDAVRAAWAHARARAIEENRPYRFALDASGRSFRTAADGPNFDSARSSREAMVLQQTFPETVRVAIGDEALPPAEETRRGTPEQAGGDWTTVVVFLPDGTARQDARLTFSAAGVRPTTMALRALTCTVTMRVGKTS